MIDVEVGENCDDWNINSGDGCSELCQIEPGYYCYTNFSNNDNSPTTSTKSICKLVEINIVIISSKITLANITTSDFDDQLINFIKQAIVDTCNFNNTNNNINITLSNVINFNTSSFN